MGKLTLHAKIEIGLAAMLLLGSCANDPYDFDYEFSDTERDEIADVAADVAYDVVLEHEKISEMESRIEEIESRLGV